MEPSAAESEEQVFEVSSPEILRTLFTPGNVRRTIRRMRAWQDSDNEVSHPLRRLILLEYEDSIAEGLAASVASGTWSPSPPYVLLVAKRSGTYRELAFPSLLDTIVGRRIIDALEPAITRDDNNKVFCGRSHANADRQRGDYENWFKVWLDFTAEIGQALETDGFTYVFDTDITQFFPSVDRVRAKSALAQRTQAHQSLLELLFYCLEAWAPRVRYCPVPGLPIEPNDVSRLIAHNFIKGVDEHFVNDEHVTYLRWVDDTVMFVKSEHAAHDVKRRHHLALREMGLSPNSSKTSIMRASEYAQTRHPAFNRRIDAAKKETDLPATAELVSEWYGRDRHATPSWDKVAGRLYSLAKNLRSDCLKSHALADVRANPSLARTALNYLLNFELDADQLSEVLNIYGGVDASVETRVEIGKFLADVPIACDTTSLAHSLVGNILQGDERLGSGYARGLMLLCLNKYGDREHRSKLLRKLTVHDLQDDQLRLHYLYVFHCRGELDPSLDRAVRHLDTPDIAVLMRACQDATDGKLTKHSQCLATCFSKRKGAATVAARYLPFLHALLRPSSREAENLAWLRKVNANLASIRDQAIRRFLADELAVASR